MMQVPHRLIAMTTNIVLSIVLGIVGGLIPPLAHLALTAIHLQQGPTLSDPWSATGSAVMGGILVWVLRGQAQSTAEHEKKLEAMVARYDTRWQENTEATIALTGVLQSIKQTIDQQEPLQAIMDELGEIRKSERGRNSPQQRQG